MVYSTRGKTAKLIQDGVRTVRRIRTTSVCAPLDYPKFALLVASWLIREFITVWLLGRLLKRA